MSDYRLRVDRHDWKCCTPDGEWDGTYDESYGYEIVDWATNIPVAIAEGFITEQRAREAGEKELERWRAIG